VRRIEFLFFAGGIAVDRSKTAIQSPDHQSFIAKEFFAISPSVLAQIRFFDELWRKTGKSREPLRHYLVFGVAQRISFRKSEHVIAERERACIIHDLF